jgi:hypothetical protein
MAGARCHTVDAGSARPSDTFHLGADLSVRPDAPTRKAEAHKGEHHKAESPQGDALVGEGGVGGARGARSLG